MIKVDDCIVYFRITDQNFVVYKPHDHKSDLLPLTLIKQDDRFLFAFASPQEAAPGWVSPPVLLDLLDNSPGFRLIVNGSYLLREDENEVLNFSAFTGSVFTLDTPLQPLAEPEPIQQADSLFQASPQTLQAAMRPYTGNVRANGVCVVASVRNEGVYLPHWIDYHRRLGVDHFFIYQNNNTDGSDPLLGLLNMLPFVTVYNNTVEGSAASPQERAYTHAFITGAQPARGYEWCFIMDIDEYITLSPAYGGSFKAFLQTIPGHVSSVSLCWQFARPTPVHSATDLLVPLPQRNPQLMDQKYIGEGYRLLKTLFRTKDVLTTTPHFPLWQEGVSPTCLLSDTLPHEYKHNPPPFINNPMFTDRLCRVGAMVLHYFSKSPTEFFLKTCRSRGFDAYVDGLDTDRLTSSVWVEPFIASLTDTHTAQSPLYNVRAAPDTGNFSYVSQFLQAQIAQAHKACAQKTWENFLIFQEIIKKEHGMSEVVQKFIAILEHEAPVPTATPAQAVPAPVSAPILEKQGQHASITLHAIEMVTHYSTELNAAALCGVLDKLKVAYQHNPAGVEQYLAANATISAIVHGTLQGEGAVASFMHVVNTFSDVPPS